MADPALDAVARSMPDGARHESAGWALAAVRDALSRVRELHQPLANSVSALHPEPLCSCDGGNWRECPTVLTCYTTEELNHHGDH